METGRGPDEEIKMKTGIPQILGAMTLLSFAALSASAESTAAAGTGGAPAKSSYSLTFDAATYTVKTSTVSGQTITYRAFEGIVYVKNPVDTKYECMNIYVPEDFYSGKTIGGFTSDTAPIFFPNGIGGYMPAEPNTPEGTGMPGLPAGFAPPAGAPAGGQGALPPGAGPGGPGGSGPNAIFVALSKGYVVASPGSRGRTIQGSDGTYTGKAPACIVDLKAAIRYLRFNDKLIPGSSERIISNGTSAGGAVSALVGATGNSKDYEPWLKALGAADARDDVYAASCYCPITNLENADMAYEWQFNGLNDFNSMSGKGTMNAEQIAVSSRLKALFPAYLNALGLRKTDGTALTLDAKGAGSFKDYVKSFIIASAQKAVSGGKDLSGQAWITVKAGKVIDIDFDKYIAYIGRMKSTPAFDAFDASAAENSLFGTDSINTQHFTAVSMEHSSVKTSMADPAIVKLMNPMNYIGAKDASTARFWRVRHGASDRDASFPIAIMLATKLQNAGASVDVALPWGQGHGGDYDKDELFAWMATICK